MDTENAVPKLVGWAHVCLGWCWTIVGIGKFLGTDDDDSGKTRVAGAEHLWPFVFWPLAFHVGVRRFGHGDLARCWLKQARFSIY